MKTAVLAGLVVLLSASTASTAKAAVTSYTATLMGAYVSPPVTTGGYGVTASLQFDDNTNLLTGTLTYSGIVGTVTGAHVHKGAACTNGVIMESQSTSSPITVNVPVVGADQTLLANGELYFDLHTAMYPNGEIRGQIIPVIGGTAPPVCGPTDAGTDASADSGTDASVAADSGPDPVDPIPDAGTTSDASTATDAGSCPEPTTDNGSCSMAPGASPGTAAFILLGAVGALARRARRRSGTTRRS